VPLLYIGAVHFSEIDSIISVMCTV